MVCMCDPAGPATMDANRGLNANPPPPACLLHSNGRREVIMVAAQWQTKTGFPCVCFAECFKHVDKSGPVAGLGDGKNMYVDASDLLGRLSLHVSSLAGGPTECYRSPLTYVISASGQHCPAF